MCLKKRRIILVTAVLSLFVMSMVVSLLAIDAYDEHQKRPFYEKHKLLNTMRNSERRADASQGAAIRRSVLLDNVPLGTHLEVALRYLESEGLVCRYWPSGRMIQRRSEQSVDCMVIGAPDYVESWLIQLDFDGERQLVDASVLVLK